MIIQVTFSNSNKIFTFKMEILVRSNKHLWSISQWGDVLTF